MVVGSISSQCFRAFHGETVRLKGYIGPIYTVHGCAVLLCLVVCLTLLTSFFLPSLISH